MTPDTFKCVPVKPFIKGTSEEFTFLFSIQVNKTGQNVFMTAGFVQHYLLRLFSYLCQFSDMKINQKT